MPAPQPGQGPPLFHLGLRPSRERFSLLFAMRVVSSAYVRLLMFLLPILILACS